MRKLAFLPKGFGVLVALLICLSATALEVRSIPWRLGLPHETYNGNNVILKAVATEVTGTVTCTWDFGDGSAVATGTVQAGGDGVFNLEALHTYPVSPDGTPYTATVTATDSSGSVAAAYGIVVRPDSQETKVNIAIDDGLWYLHKSQTRRQVGTVSDGYWSGSYSYPATTATCVLAFQNQGHRITGNADTNPYVDTVRRGLNYLCSALQPMSISPQLAGNPDSNGNGIGLQAGSHVAYTLGMVMMAFGTSGDPTAIAQQGTTNVIGRTYKDLLQDMVDMCAYGQVDSNRGAYRGGWRYGWNYGSSDNSVTQWPVVGMEAAEHATDDNDDSWGITIPPFVKSELAYWLNYSQHDTDYGFGYAGPSPTLAMTGAGVASWNWLGVDSSDNRVAKAIESMSRRWSWAGNYYYMYAVMKGMRTTNPQVTMVGTRDWYSEFADYLIARQYQSGSGNGAWPTGGYSSGIYMCSGWAILILTPTVGTLPPQANVAVTPNPAPPNTVQTFDGSGSSHLDPRREIVSYTFDFGNGVTYTETPTNAPDGAFDGVTTYAYPDPGLGPGESVNFDVTLTIVDDNPGTPATDEASVNVTISRENNPPVANPGGPYVAYANIPLTLDGSGSYDPDDGDAIESYGWEIDNVAPYDYDDGVGETITTTYTALGTYNVALRVGDGALEHTVWTTVEVRPGIPTAMAAADKAVQYSDTVNLTATLTPNSGDAAGKTVDIYVDADQDGSFEAAEVVGSATTDAAGTVSVAYTATLLPGSYGVLADFAGADPYLASFDNATLTIAKEVTVIEYTGDTSGAFGDTITLVALLKDDDGTILHSKEVSLALATHSLSVATDDAGIATGAVAIDMLPGAYNASAAYAGDEYYAASSDVETFTVVNTAPVASAGGPYAADEGETVVLDASASSDIDGSVVTYEWDLDGDLNFSDATGASVTNVWPDDFTGTITVRVTDNLGATAEASAQVVIGNVDPIVEPCNDEIVDEGTDVTVMCGVADPGTDTHVGEINWGDGDIETIDVVAGAITGTHAYADNGVYTVTFTVTDDDGGIGQGTLTITANNVAPTVDAGDDAIALEGDTASIAPSFTDSGSADTHTATIDWGDGSPVETVDPATSPMAAEHVFADNGAYTVTVTVTDDDGGVASDTLVVAVDNVPPTVEAGADQTADEGAVVSIAPTFTDPGADTHSASVDWGDGNTTSVDPVISPLSVWHVYGDNGVYTVTVTVTDDDGAATSDTVEVTVNNVAPTITGMTGPAYDTATKVCSAIDFSADFNDPGFLDTHTAVWNWGDGTTTTDTPVIDGVGNGTTTASHAYTKAGIYDVTVTVTDDDGGEDTEIHRYVVVYCPCAGFVTGGGWFCSPEGAYKPKPCANGPAHFAFVCKYLPNKSKPQGMLNFQFCAAGLNFKVCKGFEWLVVTGDYAAFLATATRDGVDYHVMVTVKDARKCGGWWSPWNEPDKIRVRLWRKSDGQVIYDNHVGTEDQPVAEPKSPICGSIVIHKSNCCKCECECEGCPKPPENKGKGGCKK